jgi:hypothetical protein
MASVIIAGKASPNPPTSSIVGSRYAAYPPESGSLISSASPAATGARPAGSIARGPNRAFSRAEAPTDTAAITTAAGSIARPAATGP